MALLTARAGLVLNPGQMADLVLAWRQLLELAALIPRERAFADDFAFVFRLAPPLVARSAPERSARRPAPRAPAKPKKRETARRKTASRKR